MVRFFRASLWITLHLWIVLSIWCVKWSLIRYTRLSVYLNALVIR